MMKSSVVCKRLENYQVLVQAREHSWVGDEPPDEHGDNLGSTPFEQLLGALGCCVIITATYYVSQAGIAVETMWLDLDDEWHGEGKDREYAIKAVLHVRGDLSDQDIQRIERAARRCPIHRLLEQAAHIEASVVAG